MPAGTPQIDSHPPRHCTEKFSVCLSLSLSLSVSSVDYSTPPCFRFRRENGRRPVPFRGRSRRRRRRWRRRRRRLFQPSAFGRAAIDQRIGWNTHTDTLPNVETWCHRRRRCEGRTCRRRRNRNEQKKQQTNKQTTSTVHGAESTLPLKMSNAGEPLFISAAASYSSCGFSSFFSCFSFIFSFVFYPFPRSAVHSAVSFPPRSFCFHCAGSVGAGGAAAAAAPASIGRCHCAPRRRTKLGKTR